MKNRQHELSAKKTFANANKSAKQFGRARSFLNSGHGHTQSILKTKSATPFFGDFPIFTRLNHDKSPMTSPKTMYL